MSYPAYPETKPSGVDWLGDVPTDWQPMRLKYLLRKKITDGPHATPIFIDDGVPFLSVDGIQNGELVFEGCRYVSEEDHNEYKVKALPEEGDILLGKAASTGKVARVKVDFEFSIWSPLALIKPNKAKAEPVFLEYAFKSHSSQAQVDVLCTSNTQKNISMDDIPSVVFALPPLPEQQQIAAFLDRKTAELDAVLRLKERQLGLLAEKRQALISQAVTRGIDPTAPLKPSGIPWLGDVPAQWEVMKIAWLFRIIGSGTTPSSSDESYYDGDIPWVNTGELEDGVIAETKKTVTTKAMQELSALTVFPTGTLLIALYGATIGKLGVLGIPATTNQACCALAESSSVSIRFAFYWFIANRPHIIAMAYGGGQPNISQELVKQLRLALPPQREQAAIVAYLDRETAQMDGIAAAIRAQIETVREYRQALISAAVTGKIDVRTYPGSSLTDPPAPARKASAAGTAGR